jgi:hypothetical protein
MAPAGFGAGFGTPIPAPGPSPRPRHPPPYPPSGTTRHQTRTRPGMPDPMGTRVAGTWQRLDAAGDRELGRGAVACCRERGAAQCCRRGGRTARCCSRGGRGTAARCCRRARLDVAGLQEGMRCGAAARLRKVEGGPERAGSFGHAQRRQGRSSQGREMSGADAYSGPIDQVGVGVRTGGSHAIRSGIWGIFRVCFTL